MKKQRFGLGWLGLGVLVGTLGIGFGACTRVESDEEDDGGPNQPGDGTGNGGGGNTASNNGGNNTVSNTDQIARGGSIVRTTAPSTAVATGGAAPTTNFGTGNVQACSGIPAQAVDEAAKAAACAGAAIEAEPLPVDMIILLDRSISNSYAVGSDSATSANAGQTTRWEVLTAAMQGLATSPDAVNLGASLTFFSYNGGSSATTECNVADYTKPVVPLGILGQPSADDPTMTQGQRLVAAMKSVSPGGLTPTVPALTGVFQYAMSEKKRDSTREKVVVLISDGYPTLCEQRSPSDVASVIAEAASANVPVKTFIIGVGSEKAMVDGAKFNLQNYARSGNTGRPPYVLDEAAGAEAVRNQLIATLLNISNSALACDYDVKPPSNAMVVDPESVSFTWKPNVGDLQEIPRVSSAAACSRSPNGGWYFDDPISPKKITTCPCTCANFGAGHGTIFYGCKPLLTIE
ncbi:MAG TPA: vWA domain-containing protein [Polyangiaceae bacterium]|nr:vWA domain-containing protein [Polyangiaceae bacterium]